MLQTCILIGQNQITFATNISPLFTIQMSPLGFVGQTAYICFPAFTERMESDPNLVRISDPLWEPSAHVESCDRGLNDKE